MRGATLAPRWRILRRGISIHAPHAGCDYNDKMLTASIQNFNPRTPCGVRRGKTAMFCKVPHFNPRTPCGVRRAQLFAKHLRFAFQSTHPMRGATWQSAEFSLRRFISIHAPHAGCDFGGCLCRLVYRNFNPRTPCGVRPAEYDVEGEQ